MKFYELNVREQARDMYTYVQQHCDAEENTSKKTQTSSWRARAVVIQQLLEETLAIANYIAQGYELYSIQRYIEYLHMAKSSVSKTKSLIHIASDCDYLTPEQSEHLSDESSKLGGMLYNYIQAMNRKYKEKEQAQKETENQTEKQKLSS